MWGVICEKSQLACRREDELAWKVSPRQFREEEQVEKRIAEVCSILEGKGALGDLLVAGVAFASRGMLALLELSLGE